MSYKNLAVISFFGMLDILSYLRHLQLYHKYTVIMLIDKYIFLLLISLFATVVTAQEKNKVLTSICVQHAYTNRHLIGARVVIQELDRNNQVLQSDSMTSAISISANLEVNHQYRITVEKAGFHTQDTIITPKIHSLSNKQRMGIYLKPIFCYYVRGYVYKIGTTEKIRNGEVSVKDLTTQKYKKLQIQEGYYEFCGRCGRTYEFKTTIKDHMELIQLVTLDSKYCEEPKDHSKRVNLEVFKNYEASFFEGESMTLHEMTFVGESIELSVEGERAMTKLILMLKQQPKLRIAISIQAQPFNERRFNRMVAEKRARYLDRKLIQGGIGEHRYLLVCSERVQVTSPRDNKKQKISLRLKS